MQPAQAQVRVHVTRVEFDPNDSIPADAQEEISEELRRRVFKPDADSAYQKDLANEIAEVPVRGALRNRGYFKVTATAKLTVSWSEEADSVLLWLSVPRPDGNNRLGDIRIESTDSFCPLVYRPRFARSHSTSKRRNCSVSKKSDLVCKTSRWPMGERATGI